MVRFVRIAPLQDIVALLLEANHGLEESPCAHQGYVVRDGGLQGRIPDSARETVYIYRVVTQLEITRTVCFGRIAGLQLHIANLRAERGIREEVIIRPALVGAVRMVFVIFELIMFVAQTGGKLSKR